MFDVVSAVGRQGRHRNLFLLRNQISMISIDLYYQLIKDQKQIFGLANCPERVTALVTCENVCYWFSDRHTAALFAIAEVKCIAA